MSKSDSSTRLQSTKHTRLALLRGALQLVSEDSFGALSLRRVTRQAGITPTAFYRHFDDMEELGLVLVEEAFGAWGAMLADARRRGWSHEDPVAGLLRVVVHHVRRHPAHFRFVVRERFGGVRPLRRAIHRELRLWSGELAIDLAGAPGLETWTADDRRTLAVVISEAVVTMVADLVEDGGGDEDAALERTGRQLGLVGWGGAGLRAGPPPS